MRSWYRQTERRFGSLLKADRDICTPLLEMKSIASPAKHYETPLLTPALVRLKLSLPTANGYSSCVFVTMGQASRRTF